ncbi:coatomer subunit gamma-like isoform X2 [Salvia splendens]|uniref:coatomer subunit gamma-like isoform X2 n=1 Tax=Salvia splendens TaxID=180675 RepID=UPI001C278D19|nr:coatomer subunit gamma-like isoform X2 [Salvia splendens]
MQWQCVKRDHDLSTNKDCSWIVVIEKHAVLTEVRGFSDPHIDKTRCLKIIKRLLYLLNQGEIFTKVSLVTSALLKDVNTGNVAYRANAIRLLCHITNDASLNKVVKFLYEDLCDDNPTLQIASLVCSINLVKRDPRMAITLDQVYPETSFYDKGKHVQFHAMYLEFVMGEVRRTGEVNPTVEVRRYHYHKIWSKLTRLCSWCSSPLGTCILIRCIRQLTRDRTRYGAGGIFELIWSCINGKDKMLAIEGFRSLGGVDVGVYIMPGFQLKDSIDVMRRMLRSHKPVVRFSAYRALQKARIVHNVECITPEDHRLMGSSKLYMEEFNHRDDEPEAEHVSQIIKSQSFAVKEASTHHCNLMRRHNV